ncbi:MAG TPA: MarR family transcriptional regulator [Actinomycetota bacterium]|nr:MarR family transcriptional regulator [Actinomycetota bacterium]
MTEPQLARLLLSAHRTLSADLGDELDERGWPDIRASQAALVLNVDRRSGTRLTELARRAGVTKQAMMIVVDELEVRGLVRRTPDPEDGRAKVVRLTARGRTFAAECRRAVAAVEARAKRTLGGRRYDGLRETLDLLLGSEEDEAS